MTPIRIFYSYLAALPPQFITPNSPNKIKMLPTTSKGSILYPYFTNEIANPMKTGIPDRMTICPVFLLSPRAAVIISCAKAMGSPDTKKPTNSTRRSVRGPALMGYMKQEEIINSSPR